MAKKKITLPKDIAELLIKSSFQELKNIFDKYDVNARGGFTKQTALAYGECPHDLAKWLIEQGADLQATDTWGKTPLQSRSRSRSGNIESLLTLGADVNYDGNLKYETPLHAAADTHNVENTRLLLEYGAKADIINSNGQTPLEQALLTCRNIDIPDTVEISKLYLDHGVEINTEIKNMVKEIGEQFEFHRANFNKDMVGKVDSALQELYTLFKVEPSPKRILHDGKSPIVVSSKTWQQQHQELWDLLVPSSGVAKTLQGEVIRVTGKLGYELEDNGGVNWDNEYQKMIDFLLVFFKKGTSLSSLELAEAEKIVNEIKQDKAGNTARLCELGVKWVTENHLPLQLTSVNYKR